MIIPLRTPEGLPDLARISDWTAVCNGCGTSAPVSACLTWTISFRADAHSYCPPCTATLGDRLFAEAGLKPTPQAGRALTPAGAMPPAPRLVELARRLRTAVNRFRAWAASLPMGVQVALDLVIGAVIGALAFLLWTSWR